MATDHGQTACAHVVVTGRVQGVSFRYYSRDTARALGLTGWVRNRDDGSVELLAEGERAKVQRLIDWCHQGPELARVDDVLVEWVEGTEELKLFAIRH